MDGGKVDEGFGLTLPLPVPAPAPAPSPAELPLPFPVLPVMEPRVEPTTLPRSWRAVISTGRAVVVERRVEARMARRVERYMVEVLDMVVGTVVKAESIGSSQEELRRNER
jgi:CHAD domain-containing protein